jgi:folylpolyglutamate synthase/dihydropteroate synthase
LIKFLPEDFNKEKVYQSETVQEAIKIAKEVSGQENLICVTGSLYLVGEAKKLLNNNSEI